MTSQVSDLTSRPVLLRRFPWPDLAVPASSTAVAAGWEAPADVDKLAWDLR
jgi:hypothetical protein